VSIARTKEVAHIADDDGNGWDIICVSGGAERNIGNFVDEFFLGEEAVMKWLAIAGGRREKGDFECFVYQWGWDFFVNEPAD